MQLSVKKEGNNRLTKKQTNKQTNKKEKERLRKKKKGGLTRVTRLKVAPNMENPTETQSVITKTYRSLKGCLIERYS